MIGILVAGGVLVIFLLICGLCLRRRRLRKRVVRLSHVPHDGMGRRSSNLIKPYNAPVPGGYHTYHQATSPVPLPTHIPQYPPRGYDTYPYHSYSRSQSTSCTTPGPTAPASLMLMRAPSSTISRPISSLDTTPLALRSSERRNEPTVPPPSSSPPPASPRSTRTNVVESSLASLPSSPSPQSPSVAISPAPAPFPRPSGPMPLPNVARPSALAPVHTGASNNIEEPPPAYTPV